MADAKTSFYMSETERSIVLSIAEGKTSREIGDERGVSHKTVEVHRRNVLKRTGCRNMPHLIHFLHRQKILF